MSTHLPSPLMRPRWVWGYLSTGLDTTKAKGSSCPSPVPGEMLWRFGSCWCPVRTEAGARGLGGMATSAVVCGSFSERFPRRRRRGWGRSALGAPVFTASPCPPCLCPSWE